MIVSEQPKSSGSAALESRGRDPVQETPASRRVCQTLLVLDCRIRKVLPRGPGKEPTA